MLEAGASERRAVDQAALAHASMVDSDRLLVQAKEKLLLLESRLEYQSGQVVRNAASRDQWKRSCEGLTRERAAEQTAAEEYASNLQLVPSEGGCCGVIAHTWLPSSEHPYSSLAR